MPRRYTQGVRRAKVLILAAAAVLFAAAVLQLYRCSGLLMPQPSRRWTTPVIELSCGGKARVKIVEHGRYIGGDIGMTRETEELLFDPSDGWRSVGMDGKDAPVPAQVARMKAEGRYVALPPQTGKAPLEPRLWNVYVGDSFSPAQFQTLSRCLAEHAEKLDAAVAQSRPLPEGVPDTRGIRPRLNAVIYLGTPPRR